MQFQKFGAQTTKSAMFKMTAKQIMHQSFSLSDKNHRIIQSEARITTISQQIHFLVVKTLKSGPTIVRKQISNQIFLGPRFRYVIITNQSSCANNEIPNPGNDTLTDISGSNTYVGVKS